MNDGLFTNRNDRKDFVANAINAYAKDNVSVKIASAFFTDEKTVSELLDKGCSVRLIVRLGFPTSPYSLKSIISHDNIKIRYFTSRSFHPKLYIFGDTISLVGSANLTRAGLFSNQEIMVSIPSEDMRFDELALLFNEYWNDDAKVLTLKDVVDYENIYNKYNEAISAKSDMDEAIINKFGLIDSNNIRRDRQKASKEDLFVEDYRKTYQESLGAFNTIKKFYDEIAVRKVPEERIPFRLEIDSFVSFVRSDHAKGDIWLSPPKLDSKQQKQFIRYLINDWLKTPRPYFEETIINDHYPRIVETFSSEKSIQNSSDDVLFDSLCVIHSFVERLRFYKNGLQGLKKAFFANNSREDINRSLNYLIHGNDEIFIRMSNMIFNSDYKLKEFGRANVQELIGWLNNQELPVINGRTMKVLVFLGFDVKY